MQAELPKIISVDDHVIEPPHLWETWLPAKYKDRAPRMVRRWAVDEQYFSEGHYVPVYGEECPDATPVDTWEYEGHNITAMRRNISAAGWKLE